MYRMHTFFMIKDIHRSSTRIEKKLSTNFALKVKDVSLKKSEV